MNSTVTVTSKEHGLIYELCNLNNIIDTLNNAVNVSAFSGDKLKANYALALDIQKQILDEYYAIRNPGAKVEE